MSRAQQPIGNDPFLGLDFFASEFGCTAKHLLRVSLVQRGLWGTRKDGVTKPMSNRAVSSYPTFVKGPGGRIGLYASQYRRWREDNHAPMEMTA